MRAIRNVVGLAILLVLWQAVAASGMVPVDYFPTVPTIAVALAGLATSSDFAAQLIVTAPHTLIGLALAVVLAVAVAIIAARFDLVRRTLDPLVSILRVLPPPAIVPISIFALGLGPRLFLFIVVFAAVWPVYLNAANALSAAEPVQILTGRSVGLSDWEILFTLRIPAAMPEIVTGIRVAGGIALLAAVASEMLAGQGGLGFVLYNAAFTLQVPEMYATMLVIGLFGVALNLLLGRISRLVVGWHIALTEQGGTA
jgi:ABC-type nitrate/sulfonate/bicarbonate transport system permease component